MRAKTLITLLLLGLAIGCAIVVAIRELRPPAASTSQPAPPTDGVIVYYFNGDFHCTTCDNFERWARDVLERDFALAASRGQLHYRVINIDQPANRHYIGRYHLVSRTIVLATYRDGKEVRWRSLKNIWDLADHRLQFEQYFRDEVAAELEAKP